MKISQKSQYGLRAMIYLAKTLKNSKKKKFCSLKEISEKENISFDFLEKIMSELEKANLVKAKRGFGGGYFLAKKPSEIKVGKIIQLLEKEPFLVKCLRKKKRYFCPQKRKCLTKNFWREVQDSFNSVLNSFTLNDLLNKKFKKSY